MFEAEIGQNINEEINQITAGGNYGWNVWEGSFKFYGREVSIEDQRGDPKMIFPIVDFDHTDPLFPSRSVAATGIYVYREKTIKALTGMLIFGDNPSGEIFYVNADALPKGGQNFHRILFNDKGETKTLLAADQGEEHPAGEDAGDPRRPADGCWTQRPAVRAEQARRNHPGAGALSRSASARDVPGVNLTRRAGAPDRPLVVRPG